MLLLPYLEKGQWWNYPSPGLKQLPGFEEGLGGLGSRPPPAAKSLLPAKSVPFPCWEEKHSAEKCLCSFPCPHLEVLADFNFCFLKDSNFFLLPIKIKIKKKIKESGNIFFCKLFLGKSVVCNKVVQF